MFYASTDWTEKFRAFIITSYHPLSLYLIYALASLLSFVSYLCHCSKPQPCCNYQPLVPKGYFHDDAPLLMRSIITLVLRCSFVATWSALNEFITKLIILLLLYFCEFFSFWFLLPIFQKGFSFSLTIMLLLVRALKVPLMYNLHLRLLMAKPKG